ncbi:RNA-binding protein 45-like [Lineus longissimus]|uniref:RNA-binding protein 45-like n=1 Tax=Lineus longissimus TaxID=88925 RepID=UPI002B4ED615
MANHLDRNDFCSPPFSRLFIIHGKTIEEATIRDAFEKYGHIEDLFMVRDRLTREYKGFSYVKFEKTSEAALAMEEMTGRALDGSSKPIKVVLANKRGEGNYRDPQEDEKMLRIFVMIPKDYRNKDLRKNFEEFGEIDFVEVVTDRRTGQNKGFGYIKYLRPYHAALAVEKCNRKYKAKFADPPIKDKQRGRDDYGPPMKRGREPYYDDYPDDRNHDMRGRDRGPVYDDRMMDPMPPPIMQNRGLMEQMQLQANIGMGGMGMGMNRGMGMAMGDGPPMGMVDNSMGYVGESSGGALEVEAMISNSHVVRPLLQKLFDLIPGLEYFNYERNSGLATARYATPEAASRCVEKMNGFEYPPGSPINVRYARSSGGGGAGAGTMDVAAVLDSLKGVPNADNLIGAMKQIASILETKSSESTDLNPDGTENVPYCVVPLPQKQPRLSPDAHCEERLFVVCKPFPVNEMILTDAFCRFGNLIEVFLQPGRNFGYARYGSKESAGKAISALNLVEINGQLMKVLVAEAPRKERGDSPHRKRTRNSEHWES